MTSPAAPGVKRSLPAQLWRQLQRERALVALFDLGREKSRDWRAARVYAVSVFVGYALLLFVFGSASRGALAHGFVKAALLSSSWVVGALAALGTAQVLSQQADHEALAELAAQRGFSRAALLRARTLAAALRVARWVALPALLLVLVGLARGSTPAWALAVTPAIVVYAALFGVVLAALAHLSAKLSPRHPRALLATLVMGWLLLAEAYPAIPGISGTFTALLEQLLATGAALS